MRSRSIIGSGCGSGNFSLLMLVPISADCLQVHENASIRPTKRCAASIVAEEPIRLRGTSHPGVLDRNPLHFAHAVNACPLVAPKCVCRIIAPDRRQAAA